MDLILRICGSAGDGSLAAGQIFIRAAAQMGYHILNFDSYPAEIRGFGKSVAHTRISPEPLLTPGESADCLIALNHPHSREELKNLKEEGSVIYDASSPEPLELKEKMIAYDVPLRELSIQATKGIRDRNIVALGVMAGLFGMEAQPFLEAIRFRFGSKSKKIVETTSAAFQTGHAYGATRQKVPGTFETPSPKRARHLLAPEVLSGNEAAARACLNANVALFAGYPITPATKILEVLAKQLPKKKGTVVQTEDEIAAIAHVLGSGYAGKRAVTATSGPGLSLMVELLNLGVMAEVPAVVIDCQRAGPSTGIPTKTEQSDLNLAIFGGHGDSFKPVLAPANVEECYSLVLKSFEVAECFQTPVIVLMDGYLASCLEDIIWSEIAPDRFGKFEERLASRDTTPYERYHLTDDGISPRALPGMKGLMHVATGLEHDASGRPHYGGGNHEKMSAKRERKMDLLAKLFAPPEIFGGGGELDVGVIAWGSTIGAAKEALLQLSQKGYAVGGLFPRLLWPHSVTALKEFSLRCKTLVVTEMNHSGQYAQTIERILHREIFGIRRVCAEPMSPSVVFREVEAMLNKGGR